MLQKKVQAEEDGGGTVIRELGMINTVCHPLFLDGIDR